MARKVFISFLGTNNYVECFYRKGNTCSEPVRFVQEALIADICKDWTEDDRIYIFCTSEDKTGEKGSKEINWEDNGQEKIYCEIEKIGLQSRLEKLKANGLKPDFEEIDICAGFTEDDIWDIFDTVYSTLKKDDQIYFDVTHAFRSIPLFSVVLFNYSKFMISTEVVSVMYGAFEKLGPAYKVRQMPLEERIVQVVDLTNIIRLQQYNQIASNLKDFGRVSRISEMINDETDSNNDIIRNLKKAIEDLDNFIVTIDIRSIKKGNFVNLYRNYIKSYYKKNKIGLPIGTILKELENELSDFLAKESYQNVEAAINWTIRHEMFTQTYPLAEEYVIFYIADAYKDFKPIGLNKGKEYRTFVSDILGAPEIAFNKKEWNERVNKYADFADYLSEQEEIIILRPIYDELRKIRNSLAHGNGEFTVADAKEKIPIVLKCLSMLSPTYAQLPTTKEICEKYN